MKSKVGLVLLLAVAFLVSMPVAADVLEVSNTSIETKTTVQEEVAELPYFGFISENMTALTVEPIRQVGTLAQYTCDEPDAGFEAGSNVVGIYKITPATMLVGGAARLYVGGYR